MLDCSLRSNKVLCWQLTWGWFGWEVNWGLSVSSLAQSSRKMTNTFAGEHQNQDSSCLHHYCPLVVWFGNKMMKILIWYLDLKIFNNLFCSLGQLWWTVNSTQDHTTRILGWFKPASPLPNSEEKSGLWAWSIPKFSPDYLEMRGVYSWSLKLLKLFTD